MQTNWKQHIKSTMAEREIEPSSALWRKIEEKLPQEKEKNSYKKWAVFSLAASLLLLISIGGYFWLYMDNSSHSLKVSKAKVIAPIAIPNEKELPQIIDSKKEILTQNEKRVVENLSKKINLRKEKSLKVEAVENKEKIAFENTKEDTLKSLKIEPSKEKYISGSELLAQVEKEMKTPLKQGVKVDEVQLLSEVEDNIFEEKTPALLDEITNGFKKFQVALREKIIQ